MEAECCWVPSLSGDGLGLEPPFHTCQSPHNFPSTAPQLSLNQGLSNPRHPQACLPPSDLSLPVQGLEGCPGPRTQESLNQENWGPGGAGREEGRGEH